MARLSPLVLIPPVVFAGLAGLFLGQMVWGEGDELPSALRGQEAPALPATTLGDLPPLTAEALRDGEPKLVNFFASWCAPCRVEHPTLTALAVEGIPIYGVAYKDEAGDSLAFLDELGNPYDGATTDPQGRAAVDWGVYGVPETFILSGDGRIVDRIAGPVTPGGMEERLREALAEAQ
jgi:cytochrome c biogenesis protein CcmG, thiol:disulfide interchange protein DsbE